MSNFEQLKRFTAYTSTAAVKAIIDHEFVSLVLKNLEVDYKRTIKTLTETT